MIYVSPDYLHILGQTGRGRWLLELANRVHRGKAAQKRQIQLINIRCGVCASVVYNCFTNRTFGVRISTHVHKLMFTEGFNTDIRRLEPSNLKYHRH